MKSEGKLIASGSGGTQPFTSPGTATSVIIVEVVVHLYIAAVSAIVLCAAGALGEVDVLDLFDKLLNVDLFHSDTSL